MSPEELEDIRSTLEFAATNGADEEFLDTAYNLIAHIDSQAAQIEALKEKLLEKQCQLMPAAPGCYADARMEAARQQLAKEMPEVDW